MHSRCLVVALLSVWATVSHAAEAESVSLFPVLEVGDVPSAVVKDLTQAVETLAREHGYSWIEPKVLRTRLKKAPQDALRGCGNSIGCIASLGRKAECQHLIIGRAAKDGRQVKVSLLLIDSALAKVARTVNLTLELKADAGAALIAEREALFGPKPESPAPAAQPEPPVEPAPVVAVSTPPASEPVPATSPPLVPQVSSQPAVQSAWVPQRPLQYAALGGAASALVAFGAATFFGLEAGQTRDDIRRDGSISQVQALRINRRANDQVRTANVLWLVGAGLGAVAGALWTYDWASQAPPEVPQ